MQPMSWKCLALIAIAMCSLAMAVPVPQDLSDAPNPLADDEGLQSEVDRDKRKIFGPDVGFGVKNAILGYVFGDESDLDNGAPVVRVTRATPVLPAGVTDDTPDLDRQQVQLDIPSEFFGSSADSALRVSEVFGNLIQMTARRYAQAVQYLKPLLGKALSIKGLYPPPATEAPTPATTESVKEARSITTESPQVIRVTRAAPVLPAGVTDDTPDFNREQVMLDIPDELFGNSFTIVTNISKVFGDLMMNSARRYANFVQYLKPFLGKALTIKGLYPPPPTTAAPTTTESSNESSSTKTESNKV